MLIDRTSASSVTLLGLTALLVTALAPASPARAQQSDDERARLHFQTATSYYDQGRYEEAATQFREAYQLSGRAHMLLNVSRCFELAGHFDAAAASLEEYLTAAPNAPDRRTLEQRIAQFRSRAPSAPAPATGNSVDLVSPIVMLAAGAVVAIAGVGTGVGTLAIQGDLEASCGPTRTCDASLRGDADTGQALALATDILLGTGIVTLGIGATLLILTLTSGNDDTAVLPLAMCSGEGCAASVVGRF